MSEKSKGDTSSPSLSSLIPSPSTRVVKNPLLSASVTGISFDDFPNKPLLLPAAPPVNYAPVPAPTARSSPSVLSPGILNRETKSLVTVGQTSSIDNETLSEINLNSNVDETQPAQIDTNSNSLLEQNTNSDSILSQAASSFSALPSVASTVFSTFSKRIYPTSPGPRLERTPVPQGTDPNANPISQLDIQPSYIQQPQQYQPHQQQQHQPHQQQQHQPHQQQQHQPHQQYQNQQQHQQFFPTTQQLPSTVPPPTSVSTPGNYLAGSVLPTSYPDSQPAAAQVEQLNSAPPLPPPKLYTPTEVPAANPAAATGAVSSIPTGGQNTYRLLAKKKIYAPIPGFSQIAPPSGVPTLDPSAITAPIICNNALQQATPYGYPPPAPYNPTQLQHQSNPEESKSGLFSIANLVPSGVFQNISGLVQSAAGTIAQTVKQEPVQQHPYRAPPQHQEQTSLDTNYFGVPHSAVATGSLPPPPSFNVAPINQPISSSTNYFTPPNSSFYPGGHQKPEQLQPQQQSVSLPQNIFVPQVPQTVQPSIPSTIQQSLPERSGQPRTLLASNTIETSTSSSGHFFEPSNLQSAQTFQTAVVGLTTATTTSVPTLDTSVTHIPPKPLQPSSGPAPGQYFDPGRFNTQTATPANIFDPFRPPSQTPIIDNTRTLYQPTPPPTLQGAAPLPPTNVTQPPVVGGSSSFRLQKGTRLYKSPLAPAEAVPRYINQPLFGQTTLGQPTSGHYPAVTHSVSPAIFNPFASSTPTSVQQSPALLVPDSEPAPTPEIHSVTSFAIEEPSTAQPIGFFNPTTTPEEKQKTPEDVKQSEKTNLIASNFEETRPPGKETEPTTNTTINTNTITSPTIFQSASQSVEEVLKPSTITENAEATPKASIVEQTIEAVFPENQDNTRTEDNLNPLGATSVESSDPLDETLHKLLLEEPVQSIVSVSESAADFLPPPPQLAAAQGTANPYRKDLAAGPTSSSSANTLNESQRILASFFTPASGDFKASGDFNFFAAPSTTKSEPENAFASTSAADFFNTTTAPSSDSSSTHLFERQTPTAPTESVDPSLDSGSFPQLPQQTCIAPPALFEEPSKERTAEASCAEQSTIAPPLGFDNIVSEINREPVSVQSKTGESSEKQQPQTDLNSVSNFFNTALNYSNSKTSIIQKSQQNLAGSTTFFDTFAASSASPITVNSDPVRAVSEPSVSNSVPSTSTTDSTLQAATKTNEDQRIQNFFNNPPPQEFGGSVGDLNYDLVHSGLPVKCQQTRSLTPRSNLVEPPSSACSEFSELYSSASLGQRQNFSAESSNKISPEEENRTPPSVVDSSSEKTNEELRSEEKKCEESVDLFKDYEDLPEEIIQALKMANIGTNEKDVRESLAASASYIPAVKHWFYKRALGPKVVWTPFSHYDSALLETSLNMEDEASNLVAVEGGRYEVNIVERTKNPVYWEGKPIVVRRCSWFYKGNDARYIPYEEHIADLLEAEYKLAAENGEWHKKIDISTGEQVVFHGPTMIVHFQHKQNVDTWGGSSQTTTRPRIVKRDLDEFSIEAGESQRVDHLLFIVHGIGSACDLKFRSVEEVVDDFRSIAQQLVSAHYKNSTDMGLVGRVEILPISWHGHLHSAEMGIDEKLKSITLESIPKLRSFTNDTLLDVLFYTSPTFCQKIMNTVAASMNSVYAKYRQRHPDFSGGVSVAGHSLGSLILFDLLCHQQPIKESEEQNVDNPNQQFLRSIPANLGANNQYASVSSNDVVSEKSSYTMGSAGAGQPFINYVQLAFQPKKFFAMGSPIGVFVTIRGMDKLGLDFRLPTCSGFYNIFHPFDPVAYRIEALVNTDMSGIPPVLIPHHKGRKRMHLELKDTMTRVGADLKQRFFDTFKNTLETVNFLGTSSPSTSKGNKENEVKEMMQKEVDTVLQMQMQLEQENQEQQERTRTDSVSTSVSDNEMVEIDFPLGKLNDSKRIDYVLQEAPLEFFNEYLFALSSHVCYWESEDTILFVMREIYSGLGINADSRLPQQSMTVERSSHKSLSSSAGGSSFILSPTT